MAYPLVRWSVIPQMQIKRERWSGGYRTNCVPIVRPGQEVIPDQPVLQLGVAEQARSGQPLPAVTGRAGIRAENAMSRVVTVPSGLYGHVVAITNRGGVVIESRALVIRGAIGAGCQVAGILTIWQPNSSQRIPAGAILVIPGPLSFAMLRQAVSSRVAGLITSSVSVRDFEGFLQTDLIRLIDCDNAEQAQQHLPTMTILLTEGLGSFAMSAPVLRLLDQNRGAMVLLTGATSVRRRIFPELVISSPVQKIEPDWQPDQLGQPDPILTLGARVRVCCGEQTGAVGLIDYLFVRQQALPSGIRTHAVRLQLDDGSKLVVPDTMVEYLE